MHSSDSENPAVYTARNVVGAKVLEGPDRQKG